MRGMIRGKRRRQWVINLWLVIFSGPAVLLAAGPLRVAALSTVLADVARNVGGSRAQVAEIVKPGVDPHEFQPTPGDVELVAAADLLLVSGKGLEGYLSKFQGIGKAAFVVVGDAVPSLKMQEGGRVVEDPHWWHSVGNVRRAVLAVRDGLVKADPAGREEFARNAAAFDGRLAALEREIKLKVADLPRDRRKLVTSHDAFGYFARDFGFTVYPIQGVTTADEPSSKKVAELVRTIRAQRVKAVFFEDIENPKVIEEITKETGARTGGELYADGLGPGGSVGATYEGMMRHNAQTIVDGLK